MTDARILPFGDAAVLIELGTTTGIAGARRARALARLVDGLRERDSRVGVPVPAAASVLVPFDPRSLTPDAVATMLAPLLPAVARSVLPSTDDPTSAPHPVEHVLHVRYGGADGPDLETVAAELGLAPADVVDLHAGTAYEVLFLGFAPGFAYLGELPTALVVPRLATPRTTVPAGSVAIADAMTAVYPRSSPGGWRLLGRTDVPLFDPTIEPPARLRPGDRVRFQPVERRP